MPKLSKPKVGPTEEKQLSEPISPEYMDTIYTFVIPKELLTMPYTYYRIKEEEDEPSLIIVEGTEHVPVSEGSQDEMEDGSVQQCEECGVFMVKVDSLDEDMHVRYPIDQ
jgi:hypothetical protein